MFMSFTDQMSKIKEVDVFRYSYADGSSEIKVVYLVQMGRYETVMIMYPTSFEALALCPATAPDTKIQFYRQVGDVMSPTYVMALNECLNQA